MNIFSVKTIAVTALLVAAFTQPSAEACTRAMYVGADDLVVTGRAQDWVEELRTDLWVFPRGMERSGEVGPKSVTWTSKYGSLSASVYEIAVGEGVNEKGLGVHLLYLADSDFGKSSDRQRISVGAYPQYILDNFATVEEAVNGLKDDKFQIVSPTINGHATTVHFAISDKKGDSAILEFIDGKLVIHHSKEYKVMTNSPAFDKQLVLNAYWEEKDRMSTLPGTNHASDRFVRASFYINAIPELSESREAVASVLSVMRNVSVPRGIKDPEKPNISTTIWRSVVDHKNLVYYYEPTYSPNVFWVSLEKLNFEKGAPVMKLELENGKRILAGEASNKFKEAEPFKFITDQK